MCGIVGYLGTENARTIVLEGLRRLEYRGYDSAGMSLFDKNNNTFAIFKEKGRINALEKILTLKESTVGIGHTRWATHGRVTKQNAHPHTSKSGRYIVVHNGVIENHHKLKETYLADHRFESETDTEVVAQLIETMGASMNTENAILSVLRLLRGSYALLVIDTEDKETLYAAKHKSPMLIGRAQSGMVIGSDMMALAGNVDNYLALEDETFARLTRDNFTLYNLEGEVLPFTMSPLDLDDFSSEKGEFPHYMLKEIHEQPAVLRRIIGRYFNETDTLIDGGLIETIKAHDRIHILAAGTSMHAGLVAKTLLESLAKIPTEVHIASEFAYHEPLLTGDPFFILISQSGETADLRACLVNLKKAGRKTLTVTNVRTSTLAREAQGYLEIHAGPEIAVASTKAYTAQIAVLAILAYSLSEQSFDLKRELSQVALAMEHFLAGYETIGPITETLLKKENCFYIGRGLDYAVCLEAALKLKEISYIQTEGFAAGELKHGTIALIEEGTPVIGLVSNARTAENTRSNLNEVKSRGANVLIIASESLKEKGDGIVLEDVSPSLSPLLTVVPTQLIAYYAALHRGYDIDKPRNLAKSVTVE